MNWAAITYSSLIFSKLLVVFPIHHNSPDRRRAYLAVVIFMIEVFLLWQAGLFQ